MTIPTEGIFFFIKKTLKTLGSFFTVALFLGVIIPYNGVSQKQISVIVKSSSTGEVIQYANIILKGKQGGTYSNEEGIFEYTVTDRDTIVISSIGYKTKAFSTSEIKAGNYEVYLDQEIYALDGVTIRSKKEKVKADVQTFGYTKSKRRSLISSGIPGIQFATYINNDAGREGVIKSILLGIKCEHKSRIRIRLYHSTKNFGVGDEITRTSMVFDVTGNHKPYSIDVSENDFLFPVEGIIVAVEFLGELDKDGKIKKGTTTSAMLYLTDGRDLTRNTWQSYRERPFIKESFSDFQQNTSNALIGLTALFNR